MIDTCDIDIENIISEVSDQELADAIENTKERIATSQFYSQPLRMIAFE